MQPISDLVLPGIPPISVRKLAFTDAETTGWSLAMCEIIDACVICDGLPWQTKIRISPWDEERGDRTCGRGWRTVTGYTREEWAEAPLAAEIVEDLARQLHGKILVGHNVGFDAGFYQTLLERHGISWRMVYSGSMIDTYPLCKAMLGPLGLTKFSLEEVCGFLGIEKEGDHRAVGGAKRARLILHELCKRVAGNAQT